MRTITKRTVPASLTQWRAARMTRNRVPGMDCIYSEMRRDTACLVDVEDGLFAEQGGICAYTGLRLWLQQADQTTNTARDVDYHIEHLVPQAYCNQQHGNYGMDTDYRNMVACWPRPNCGFEPAYGARKKGSWPSPAEQGSFVSPLSPDCSSRFIYRSNGKVEAAQGDAATDETIRRLGLCHDEIVALRRSAIQGALHPNNRQYTISEARRALAEIRRETSQLDQGQFVQLKPFCFVIEQAFEREIHKLRAIRGLS